MQNYKTTWDAANLAQRKQALLDANQCRCNTCFCCWAKNIKEVL